MNKILLVLAFAAVACAIPLQQKHKKLSFTVSEEWALVPDGSGQLHIIHKSEIFDPELEGNFAVESDVKIFLYNRQNDGQQINFDDAGSVAAAGFNPGWPTRFIIHGWNNDVGSDVNVIIRSAFRDTGDYNVFVVDWGEGANTVNYISARNLVNDVGPHVGRFITNILVNQLGASHSDVHIIGHSLGGHTAGIAGKHTGPHVRVCYGLDPAGPLFDKDLPNERINYSDAEYVEIIHTAGSSLGFMDPIGDADFYPNGGKAQEGCGLDLIGTCAHSRAYQYFAESVRNSEAFRGVSCEFSQVESGNCAGGSEAFMGYPGNAERGVNGIFHLRTYAQSPFGQG